MAAPSNEPTAPVALTGVTRDELRALLAEWGEPAYRAEQILDWVFRKRVESIDAMTNLSRALRERLEESCRLHGLSPVRQQGAEDSTRKFLFALGDGQFIESVLIPASPALYGEASDRLTLCVSTQVGCAYGCAFCASGLAGFTRNLGADEIVEQVLLAEKLTGEKVNNLVFMGMGEPLANLDAVLRGIGILNAPWGVGIGARHITVSTSGLAPQIRKLADSPLQVRLAISLHGATDAVREKIMPVNRKHPLRELFAACRYFSAKKKQRLTFEYILIDGVNDALDEAKLLARHAVSLNARINLIPYNDVEGLPWKRPSLRRQDAFLDCLKRAGGAATLRREKGGDIDAACGQLRLKEEAGGEMLR